MIFGWLAYEAFTLRQIIKRLHEMKIKPKNGKDVWATSTLARLVRREDYIGKSFYNKTYSLIPSKPLNGNGYKRFKKTSRKYKPREDWYLVEIPKIVDD